MKNFFTVFCLVLSMSGFCQMKVSTTPDKPQAENIGSANAMGVLLGKITKEGSICVFTYRDLEFKQIDEYRSFSFNYSDLDTLYGLFTDLSNVKEGDSLTVDLESGDKLIFDYKKSMGKLYAYVTHVTPSAQKVLPYYTPRQLKKIFGKK